MTDYVPMKGPFPGAQYQPSNGTEGACFIEGWCCNCARDKEMNGTRDAEGRDPGDDDFCPILGASMSEDGGVVEWREIGDFEYRCMAFVPLDQPVPAPRCEHTLEMFS